MSASNHFGKRSNSSATNSRPPSYFARQRIAARKRKSQFAQDPFEAITCPENLYRLAQKRWDEGIESPGPSGIRFGDMSRSERWEVLRALSEDLRRGSYRPGAAREVAVKKMKGNGFRTITIREWWDAAVSAALNEYLAPKLDSIFLDCSYGFRKGRGAHMMLAEIVATITAEERWVVAIDDIRKAFDFVRVDDAVELFRQHIDDDRIFRLTETILRGGNEGRQIGIEQGNAISPLGLNLVLHHGLDKPSKEDADLPPDYRYADNLNYLCRTASEGEAALANFCRRLDSN